MKRLFLHQFNNPDSSNRAKAKTAVAAVVAVVVVADAAAAEEIAMAVVAVVDKIAQTKTTTIRGPSLSLRVINADSVIGFHLG